jgi:hypothetical protein
VTTPRPVREEIADVMREDPMSWFDAKSLMAICGCGYSVVRLALVNLHLNGRTERTKRDYRFLYRWKGAS